MLENLDAWWQASQRLATVLAKPDTEPQTWHTDFMEEIFERTPCYGNDWAKFLYGDIGSHLAGSKADLARFTGIGPGCFEMLDTWGLVFHGSVTERQRQGLEAVNELRLVVQAIFQAGAHRGIQRARDDANLQEPSAYEASPCPLITTGYLERPTRSILSQLMRRLQHTAENRTGTGSEQQEGTYVIEAKFSHAAYLLWRCTYFQPKRYSG